MSEADSDADSISDGSNAYSDDDDDDADGDQLTVHEFCDRLRANYPRVLGYETVLNLDFLVYGGSEALCIEVFQALKENTIVKCIDFNRLFDRNYTKSFALVAAEYVESSKTLQTLDLSDTHEYSHEICEKISLVLRALSRNTSVTELIINTETIRFASVAFQELLTCTQTIQKVAVIYYARNEGFDEADTDAIASGFANNKADTDAIASGFANNTTLRDLEFNSWQETDLAQR
jgi:hypothetical protein